MLRSEVATVKVQKGAAEKELKAVLLELEEMTCARDEADAYLGDQLAITLQLETSLKHQLAEATRLQDECTQLHHLLKNTGHMLALALGEQAQVAKCKMMICMGVCVSAVRMSGQTEWRHSSMGWNERMRAYTPPPDHLLKKVQATSLGEQAQVAKG